MIWSLLPMALAGDDVPVPLQELPPPVVAAVEAQWPGCTLLEAEKDAGLYDVECRTTAGEVWEAEVKPDGTIVETELERHADGAKVEHEDEDDEDEDEADDD